MCEIWWVPIKSIKSSGHGMDIMMSSFGVLLGYTKPREMFHTSTRQRNTTTISAWRAKQEYSLGMIRLLEFTHWWLNLPVKRNIPIPWRNIATMLSVDKPDHQEECCITLHGDLWDTLPTLLLSAYKWECNHGRNSVIFPANRQTTWILILLFLFSGCWPRRWKI